MTYSYANLIFRVSGRLTVENAAENAAEKAENIPDELGDLAYGKRKDCQRQDNKPSHGVQCDVVKDRVNARDVNNSYEHYE